MHAYDFKDLFVLDLANNHQGDLQHGINIIRSLGEVAQSEGVKAGIKFQFRELDSFIHPDYKNRTDLPHIPRFMSTALTRKDYARLVDEISSAGMEVLCTPFDEPSVDALLELGIGIIKVASCSATDWPLLERIAAANRPVIVSTAGLTLEKMDRVVSFMEYHDVNFALMHCVAIYPTPEEKLNLNQIELMTNRYRNVTIGFSTHEDPRNLDAVKVAYAKGARIFERHVGMQTEKHKLNAYSSTPETIRSWIQAHKKAVNLCGGEERTPSDQSEIASLRALQRGVFAKNDLKKGQEITAEDVFFAMPLQDGQLLSGNWVSGIEADRDYAAGEPINEELADLDVSDQELIFTILLQVKGMLNRARVPIGRNSAIEISHHYGLNRFREFGAVIVDCVNREYCKKLIIMLPRQKHPYHYHERKEETFQLLYGDLEVEISGHKTKLDEGDTLLIEGGNWHKFHTLDGAIFEEISTTHYNDDSFYEDERIAKLPRDKRKTKIPNWEAAEKKMVGGLK